MKITDEEFKLIQAILIASRTGLPATEEMRESVSVLMSKKLIVEGEHGVLLVPDEIQNAVVAGGRLLKVR